MSEAVDASCENPDMGEKFHPDIVYDPEFGGVVQIVDEYGIFAGYDPTTRQIAKVAEGLGLSVEESIELADLTKLYHEKILNDGNRELDPFMNSGWPFGPTRLADIKRIQQVTNFGRIERLTAFPSPETLAREAIRICRYYDENSEGGNND